MSTGFVHFLQGPDPRPSLRLQTAVLGYGLGLRLHTELNSLCAALEELNVPGTPRLVLVAGGQEFVSATAEAARRLDPAIRVLALLDQVSEDILLQALRSGVDACWPMGAKATLIAAQLARFVHFPEACASYLAGPGAGVAQNGWQVEAGGWALRSGAIRISLTSAERAFVYALYLAPGHTLSHADMVSAIKLAAGKGSAEQAPLSEAGADAAPKRLSVLMSRLRSKFNAAGVEMPIRSMRGLGYALNLGACPGDAFQAAGAVVPAMPCVSLLP